MNDAVKENRDAVVADQRTNVLANRLKTFHRWGPCAQY
jgi:hypothetical protein